MNKIDKLQLMAELVHENCVLNHGPDTREEDFPAVDYLVIPIGYKEDNTVEVSAREMVIPICKECASALQGEEWTLLYCIECTSSRWVCRQFAKNRYRHHILWLRGCPDCSKKFGGLYFADNLVAEGDANFLKEKKKAA